MHHTGLSISFQNVTPHAGSAGGSTPGATPGAAGTPTPGVAVSDASGAAPSSPASGSMLTSLLPFAMLIPFLFLMFRKNKKEAERRSQLKKGDRVVSTSGLIGELMEMDERFAKVKLAPGTTVQMLVSSISPLDPVATTATDKDLKDLKDAKATATDKK